MLTLYANNTDAFTKRIERKLEEMVVAHKVIMVEATASLPQEIKEHSLPILTDGHQVWQSKEEIQNFLEGLHQELILGHKMQSDSCVIDPDNPDECL